MKDEEFKYKFQDLFTNMVEIAFELVDNNTSEVDGIYIYGAMEGVVFYNVFYRINGRFVKLYDINTVSRIQYDLSVYRVRELIRLGDSFLQDTIALFKADNREVPTVMKMVYKPKTGAFNNDVGYELQYSDRPGKTHEDAFREWFEEIRSQNLA